MGFLAYCKFEFDSLGEVWGWKAMKARTWAVLSAVFGTDLDLSKLPLLFPVSGFMPKFIGLLGAVFVSRIEVELLSARMVCS